ncbi:glycoside hydrolase [Violaceomyces palustris]|uniref:Glycoside hydrolase n=1 Tax=Violaceomyces palustris TaxID=1673888 RepID=A0ACD0NWR0_9BASI|nr:glycoside hydrolase [Violaceomyces palustris]
MVKTFLSILALSLTLSLLSISVVTSGIHGFRSSKGLQSRTLARSPRSGAHESFRRVAANLSRRNQGSKNEGEGNGSQDRTGFIKGVNVPWGNGPYGHWLSKGLVGNWEAEFKRFDLISTLQAAKETGSTWVRIWIFEGGQGLKVDEEGRVISLNQDLFQNLDYLFHQAESLGLEIFPTLFSEYPGTRLFPVSDFLADQQANVMMMENAVKPFLDRYGGRITALELWNELDQYGNSNYYSTTLKSSGDRIPDWVKTTTETVKSLRPDLNVTVSQIYSLQASSSSNSYFQGLGLDFYTFHFYPDSVGVAEQLVPSSQLGLDRPVLIGEFGSKYDASLEDQVDLVRSVLQSARSNGYMGALSWLLGTPGQRQADCQDTNGDGQGSQNLLDCRGGKGPVFQAFKES